MARGQRCRCPVASVQVNPQLVTGYCTSSCLAFWSENIANGATVFNHKMIIFAPK